jgi:G patch domain-containing protein 1
LLNPDQRRDILGEEVLKGPDRSITDRQRAQTDISNTKQEAFFVPKISKEIAMSALRGFMPFGDDKINQEIFNFFLGLLVEDWLFGLLFLILFNW